MTEKEETCINGIDLEVFKGDLLWLVKNYVLAGDLPTQEAVNKLADIIKETIETDDTGDNEARTYFNQRCLEEFGLPLDLYNDPEDRFGRKDVLAGNLLKGLVEEKQKK